MEDNYSIYPRKTFNVKFPTQVPEEYWKDIIRGYFDGDGCITYTSTGYVSINYTGTPELLDFIRLYFKDILGIKIKNKSISKLPPIHMSDLTGQITYSGKNAMAILNWMYDNSDQYLNRKYKRYLQAKDSNGRVLKYND